jgi:hypothetical protein
VKFNGTVNVTGDAYLYQGAQMTLVGNSKVNGVLYYDSMSMVVSNSSTALAEPMTPAGLMLRDSILKLATAADGEAATQPLDPANPASVNLSTSESYAADPTKMVNVISAQNIMLGSGQSLTFTGGATSVFVLKISGAASFGDGIVLNGVTPNHLLVYITSANSTALVTVGGTSGVEGTFLAPTRALKFSGNGNFTGALISGAVASPAIEVGGNGGGQAGQFDAEGFCTVTGASPSPSPSPSPGP